MVNTPSRSQITQGGAVSIETKRDQGTGRLTPGIVEEILTSGESHPHGIKVRLRDGQVGRVKSVDASGRKAGPPKPESGFVDLSKREIPKTEDQCNEFKEFYQYNKSMEKSPGMKDAAVEGLKRTGQRIIATAVCAFGNSSKGGFLYIGIDFEGTVVGLEKDRELGGFADYDDSFANHIRDRLGDLVGDKVFMTSRIQLKFRDVEGRTVCIIQVLPSGRPLWLHGKNDKMFFVRGAVPRAEKLDSEEQIRYIRERFPNYR